MSVGQRVNYGEGEKEKGGREAELLKEIGFDDM